MPSSETAVSEHIYGTNKVMPCNIYHETLKNNHGDQPSPTEKISFIKNCFSVKQSNLKYMKLF